MYSIGLFLFFKSVSVVFFQIAVTHLGMKVEICTWFSTYSGWYMCQPAPAPVITVAEAYCVQNLINSV